MNLIAYTIYSPIVLFTTFYLGWVFYSNGKVYLQKIFVGQEAFGQYINKLLLIGYYLVNIGIAFYTIIFWESMDSLESLFALVSTYIGRYFLFLALLHFNNLICIKLFFTKNQSKI